MGDRDLQQLVITLWRVSRCSVPIVHASKHVGRHVAGILLVEAGVIPKVAKVVGCRCRIGVVVGRWVGCSCGSMCVPCPVGCKVSTIVDSQGALIGVAAAICQT